MSKVDRNTIVDAIRYIDTRTNSYSTEEQIEFASDFTSPMISFSNPGTGKTHSIVRGLILAQTVHGIAGRNINAMSFTREATAELGLRYQKVCSVCNMTPTIQFNTFHSICRRIVLEKYPTIKVKDATVTEDALQSLKLVLKDVGIDTEDMYFVKQFYDTISSLNHKMVYDPANVELSYEFKQLEVDLELFQEARKQMFVNTLSLGVLSNGDLPLYALFVLGHNEDIRKRYKEQYKIMVVDEFQDMTKLYIVVLSMICDNLIAIGDIKQQIYGFAGASSDIVELYKRLYPNAKEANLTQSFRCKSEIADFATEIYRPNNLKTQAFKGTGDGGVVQIKNSRELDIKSIVQSIAEDNKQNAENKTDISTMFLFRNNMAITPIAEELYKQRVPFRVKKFVKIMDMEIFSDLCLMCDIANDPTNIEYVKKVWRFMPEFAEYRSNPTTNPLIERMIYNNSRSVTKCSLFDVDYVFNEESQEILTTLKSVSYKMKNGCMCSTAFTLLLPIYDKYVIKGKWYLLKNTLEYAKQIVAPIVNNKTYEEMVADEYAKDNFIMDNLKLLKGVKCFTMHSAKGLEADYVYIIDADKGIHPNDKSIDKMCKAGCEFEASKIIREERNLLYVAITRAKQQVVITHTGELTDLINMPMQNKYNQFDNVYLSTKHIYNDTDYFLAMTNTKVGVENNDKITTYTSEDRKSSDDFVYAFDLEAI